MSEIEDDPDEWQTRIFRARTCGEARALVSQWLGDFASHGPLEIRSIRTEDRGMDAVATLTFRTMQPKE